MENRNYKCGFYRLPRLFFTPRFPIPLEAKVLYAMIADRICISTANRWHDRQGTYCYFTVSEVAEILGCGYEKARKLFGHLEKYKLITRVRQGQGKPTRLYLNDSRLFFALAGPETADLLFKGLY